MLGMGIASDVKTRVTTTLREMSARAGYPIIPQWRLEKWEQSQHLRELFALLDIDCVLDVGANIGQYHEFLRLHLGYDGPVVSFEPVREMYERLVQITSGDPRWTVHRLALGSAEGTADINVLAERTLSSLLAPNAENLRSMGYEKYLRETQIARTEPVPVKRLDGICDQVLPPGARRVFLKSDTQGYDMQVIRGASGCLDRLPAIQLELPVKEVYAGAPNYLDAIAELTTMGYEVTGLFPVQRDATLRIINVDVVMIRRDVAEALRAARRHAPGHAGRP
jgi:FkbM family methyltransferase